MNEQLKPHTPASPEKQEEKKERLQRREDRYNRVGELETQVKDLKRRAETDALTGLLNRSGSSERIKGIFENVGLGKKFEAVSMIAIDIDHFKQVNDTYGHAAGDEVLKALGKLLANQFRADDVVGRLEEVAKTTSVARPGGEEFLVCMPGASSNDAARKAEVIRREFEKLSFSLKNGKTGTQEERHFSMSIGVASTGNPDGAEEVMEAADVALYKAKESGRNRVVRHDSLSDDGERIAA